MLPDLTTHRKVMASVQKLDEQEKVAALMKHSLATQQRYYRHLQTKKDSVEAFELLNSKLLPLGEPQVKRYLYKSEDEETIKIFSVTMLMLVSYPPCVNAKFPETAPHRKSHCTEH